MVFTPIALLKDIDKAKLTGTYGDRGIKVNIPLKNTDASDNLADNLANLISNNSHVAFANVWAPVIKNNAYAKVEDPGVDMPNKLFTFGIVHTNGSEYTIKQFVPMFKGSTAADAEAFAQAYAAAYKLDPNIADCIVFGY